MMWPCDFSIGYVTAPICVSVALLVQDGMTALMLAVKGGDIGVLRYLLEHGADLNAADDVRHERWRYRKLASHLTALTYG